MQKDFSEKLWKTLRAVGLIALGLVFYFLDLLPQAPELVGWSLIVAAAVNVAKLIFGDRVDGWAGRIAQIANFVLLGIVWIADYFGARTQVETVVEQLGVILPIVVSWLMMIGGSELMHRIMASFDSVFSFSARKPLHVAENARTSPGLPRSS